MTRNSDLARPLPFASSLYFVGSIVLVRVVLGFLGLH